MEQLPEEQPKEGGSPLEVKCFKENKNKKAQILGQKIMVHKHAKSPRGKPGTNFLLETGSTEKYLCIPGNLDSTTCPGQDPSS